MVSTTVAVVLPLLGTVAAPEPVPRMAQAFEEALRLPEGAHLPEEPAPRGELWLPAAAPEEEPEPALIADLDEEDAGESAEPAGRPRSRRRARGDGQAGSLCGRVPPSASFTIAGHVFTARWIDLTLHGVIANRCRSKTYRDILPLDGGTVGISHFAVGSLFTLYTQMPLRRYFGAHASRMPSRPYRFAWWRKGMRRFLRSSESRRIQVRAWRNYIRPALKQALAHNWSTDRDLAIAASVANSLGAHGFHDLAAESGWRPETTLFNYARLSDHKERRRQRLNREFPMSGHASK